MRDGLVSYEAGGSPFPEFRRGQTEVLEVARQAIKEGRLGLDLEFSPATGKAHIIGTASKSLSAGARFSAELCRQIVREASESNAQFVGHSVLDADKPIVEGYLGHETPLTAWDDSMLRGYLCNSDWCSQPGKTEDDDDKGALGLMNLGTMGTYYLGVPLWKRCRDIGCTGPCPEHDEEWYCAVDSWAGLRIADKAREEMTKRNIPEKLYEDLKKLSIYCGDMQRRGVAIDREWVERLEKGIVEKKAELFPSEMKLATPRSKKEKKVWSTPFNPNSPKDIIKWFAENGLPLEAKKGSPTGKDTIRKTLERALKKFRIPYDIDRKSGILEVVEEEADIPEAVDYLLRLDRYKRAGKGLKSWFDDEYFGADGYIHPRFIVTGTATGRLASSGPNFQNIPKRGFGSLVRAAIVPREKGLQLLKSDKCLAPGTRILTKDLRWVAIEKLIPGDEVVGFDEKLGGFNHCMRHAHVVKTDRVLKNSVRLTFASGKQIICSTDHQWVVPRKKRSGGGATRTWVTTEDLVIGDTVAKFIEPWEENTSWEAGWMAGMFDGEGSFYRSSAVNGQNEGPTLDLLEAVLQKDGFTYHRSVRPQQQQKRATANYVRLFIKGAFSGIRVIGYYRPPRLLPKAIARIEGLRSWGKCSEVDRICNIETIGQQELIAVQTSTGTMIAEGLMTHNCQLEMRIVFFYAGEEVPAGDPFSRIVNDNVGLLDDAARNASAKVRDIAKSIVHAGDYLEGLAVVGDTDLAKERIQKEISLGARLVFDGKNGREKWEYRGGYVSFTGANLAERIFGDKSLANRARALQIQEAYFRTHPGVRRWQQEVSREVERTRAIRSYTGRSLQLYGTPEDDLKLACAFLGQGGGADEVQEAMLRYQAIGHTALLQVHDELVFEAPADWTDSEIKKFFSIFSAPSERFDGREFPVDVQKGMNWCAAGEMNPHGLVEVA